MKQLIAIVAVAVTLASCGGSSTTEVTTTDSTVVKADTCQVKCDSTKVVDTTKAAK